MPDDGVSVVPVDVTDDANQETTVDPTIKQVLDQGFANTAQMFGQSAARFNTSSELTANEAARMFQLESQLVGAAAAGRLDRDQLAHGILQQNSARDQPGANKAP